MARKISFLSLLLFFIVSCQSLSETAAPRLFGELYMRYLAPERILRAEATFLRGDSLATAVPHTFPGGLAFQGSHMDARLLVNEVTRYQYEGIQDYPAEGRFSLKTEAGADPINLSVMMSPLGAFSVQGPVSRSRGFTLIAEGSSLSEEESLVMLFADPNKKASTIILRGPSDSERHVFLGKQVGDFALGTHQLYLVKKKVSTLKAEGVEAQATVEYFSDVLEVEVVP